MWRAVGVVPAKRPNYWLENKSTKEFIDQIDQEVNPQENQDVPRSRNSGSINPMKKQEVIMTIKGKGKAQGTYAHWKIGLAYTTFLNPEVHSWFMEIGKARFLEERVCSVSMMGLNLCRPCCALTRMSL